MSEVNLNPILNAIKTRRSVRSFNTKPIPKAVLEQILESGSYAPSGGNRQPWRFIVTQDQSMRDRLRDTAYPLWRQECERTEYPEAIKAFLTDMYQKCLGWKESTFDAVNKRRASWKDAVFYGAPVVVFVIGSGKFAHYDCPMVCLNMMLAAHSVGIGSSWVSHGLLPLKDDGVKEALGISQQEEVFGPILFGYPRIIPSPPLKKQLQVNWI